MAAADPVKDLKERATCPICLDLFRDPVVTECGHSFCRECIARHCQGDGDVVCPQCRKKFQKGNLRPNWELRNMVESLPPLLRSRIVEESRGGPMCDRHQEPLQLYCKEHQSPICVFCERSQAHRGHTVVLVEEAVQEYWETLTKHLAGMESTYGRLHPLVSMDRKHLSPSAGEEAHEKLKRLADNVVTLFKVDTEGPRQRSHGAESQTQPCDPEARGSPARKDAGETESQEHKGREPGREPAAEKQEETRTHVGHVCEEAPTPKYGLDQASLDPEVHSISSRRVFEKSKVAVKGQKSRFEQLLSPDLSMLRVGSWMDRVSPAGQGAAQTESGGDTGRGGRESQELEAAAAGVPTKVSTSPLPLKRQNTLPPSETQQPADAPSRGDSLQGLRSESRDFRWSWQDSVSPGGNVATLTELQGFKVEVTLDPATAHPRLVLSGDGKGMSYTDHRWNLPDNLERFDISTCALGSQGFTSGRHYWEVEVGSHWAIGVTRDAANRKGNILLKPSFGFWTLSSSELPQSLPKGPRKIGVYLDYEGGEVTFYDAENRARISSLTATFTGKVFPFFHLRSVGSYMKL